MSGRHRQGGSGITHRALAGTIPVLGAAGAMTGLVLSSGASAPGTAEAEVAAVDGPVVDEPVAPTAAQAPEPALTTGIPGRADQAVSAVSAATDAAREQDALAQARDQRSVTAVVEGIRADARERDAAAQQQGNAEFAAFQKLQQDRAAQDDAARDRQAREQPADGSVGASSDAYEAGPSGAATSEPGECDLSGLPRLSPLAGSDEIVNRDCGLTDDQGMQRSQDSWIDDQMQLAADRDD